MSFAIIKIDVRKVLPYYVPVLLLVIGFILLWKTPLATGNLILNLILNLIACLQGMVIAWMLFHDSGGTAAFIFSRPLSRNRLFLTRWCCGILFQFLTVLAIFVTISTGLRSAIQLLMNSPYQPMVKWYELSILASFALYSLLGYQSVMFLRLRAKIVSVRPPTWRDNLKTVSVIALCFLVIPGLIANIEPMHYQLTYATLVMVLGTLGSLHCYQCIEVEA